MHRIIFFTILFFNAGLVYSDTNNDLQLATILSNKVRMAQHLALNPVLVKAVQQQNEQEITKSELLERNNVWTREEAQNISFNTGDHAIVIKRFMELNPSFNQITLTDNRGASVAAFPFNENYL